MDSNQQNIIFSNRLLWAAEDSNTTPEFLKFLLREGADINVQDKEGNTALHKVINLDRLDLFQALFSQKANVTIINKQGQLPLDIAKQINNKSILHPLTVATKYNLANYKDNFLLFLSKIGNLGAIKKVIEQDKADINTCNVNGVTALHLASIGGYVDIVKYFIERGADKDAEDLRHTTALHYALMNDGDNFHEIVTFLIKKGADYTIRNQEDYSIFYKLAYRGYNDVINLLLSKDADVNEISVANATPLHGAVMGGSLQTIYLLLSNGADVTVKNSENNLPYHLARIGKYRDIATVLDSQITKLISAAANGRINLVKSFLKTKCDVNSEGYYGERALDLAVKYKHMAVVIELLNKGAVIKTDIFGDTTLHIAAKNKDCEIMDILVKEGRADISYANWLNKTAIDYAPECKYLELQVLGEVDL